MKNEMTVRMISMAREKLLTAITHTGDYEDMELETLIEEALWDVMAAVVGMRDTEEDGAEQWNRAFEMGKYEGLKIVQGIIEDFVTIYLMHRNPRGEEVIKEFFDVEEFKRAIETEIKKPNNMEGTE